MEPLPADPLSHDPAARAHFLRAVESEGTPFRRAFEELLVELPPVEAYRLEWGSRESVGAAALLAKPTSGAPALVLGSGVLGTAPALVALGFDVVVADASQPRLRFAAARGRDLGARIDGVEVQGPRLPFRDGAFGLVCLPDVPRGLPERVDMDLDAWLAEVFRVLAPGGQVLLLAENRLAYKEFTGLHGRFRVPGPARAFQRAIAGGPARSEAGYASALAAAGFEGVQGYATYVSHLDYHYVASLEPGGFPALEVGRKERRGLVKWIGYRLGLFRWFTPSFAFLGEKPGGRQGASILETVARAAAEAAGLDARRVRVDHLLATRGNAALALLSVAGANGTSNAGLVARIPLCRKENRLALRHLAAIRLLRRRLADGAGLPIPMSFGEHNVCGIRVYVESRCAGTNAAQHTDDPATRVNTYTDLARILARLVRTRRIAGDTVLERVVFARARFVASRVRDPETARLVLAVAENVAARLRGRSIPLVLAHADLRAKHCTIDAAGHVTGILDWGTIRLRNLPLYDLLHFIVHDRKQQQDESLNAATLRALHPRRFSAIEEAAISRYCADLDIGPEVRRACELFYPVEVPATTMAHWAFDRPRWVEVNFGAALRAAAAEG